MGIETLLPATALVCRLPVVGVPIVEKNGIFLYGTESHATDILYISTKFAKRQS